MLDKRYYYVNQLYQDMPIDEQHDWFGYSQKKFLHNIDTFYYSVKFRNDFRLKTSDAHVLKMRRFFKLQYDYLNNNEDQPELYLPDLGKNLYLKPVTFSRFYTTCLTSRNILTSSLLPWFQKQPTAGNLLPVNVWCRSALTCSGSWACVMLLKIRMSMLRT